LASSTEMLRLASETGEWERALEGHRWRLMDFLEVGDIVAADQEIDAHSQLAEKLRHAFSVWLVAIWRAMRAFRQGDYALGEALIDFETLAAKGFADFPLDGVWLISMSFLAQVCAALEDTERATILYGLLLPHAGRSIVVGLPPIAYYGPVSYYLGLLAALSN